MAGSQSLSPPNHGTTFFSSRASFEVRLPGCGCTPAGWNTAYLTVMVTVAELGNVSVPPGPKVTVAVGL